MSLNKKGLLASAALLAVVGQGFLATPASAGYTIQSPIVEQGEVEVEHYGHAVFDDGQAGNHEQEFSYSVAAGITDFWKLELEAETENSPEEGYKYEATGIESTFALAPQGKYWADFGFYLEYAIANESDEPDTLEFGPIVQKEVQLSGAYNLINTANIFFEKEIGTHATGRTGFAPALQSRVTLNPLFEPGVEFFAEIEDLHDTEDAAEQSYNFGPVLTGEYKMGKYGELKYEAGYLFGLTAASPDAVLKWKLEYEIPF